MQYSWVEIVSFEVKAQTLHASHVFKPHSSYYDFLGLRQVDSQFYSHL